MKNSDPGNSGRVTQRNPAEEEIRSRGGQKLPGKVNNPGGAGSQERVPAKGNDITREDDLLQNDIDDEVDNALDEQDDEQ